MSSGSNQNTILFFDQVIAHLDEQISQGVAIEEEEFTEVADKLIGADDGYLCMSKTQVNVHKCTNNIRSLLTFVCGNIHRCFLGDSVPVLDLVLHDHGGKKQVDIHSRYMPNFTSIYGVIVKSGYTTPFKEPSKTTVEGKEYTFYDYHKIEDQKTEVRKFLHQGFFRILSTSMLTYEPDWNLGNFGLIKRQGRSEEPARVDFGLGYNDCRDVWTFINNMRCGYRDLDKDTGMITHFHDYQLYVQDREHKVAFANEVIKICDEVEANNEKLTAVISKSCRLFVNACNANKLLFDYEEIAALYKRLGLEKPEKGDPMGNQISSGFYNATIKMKEGLIGFSQILALEIYLEDIGDKIKKSALDFSRLDKALKKRSNFDTVFDVFCDEVFSVLNKFYDGKINFAETTRSLRFFSDDMGLRLTDKHKRKLAGLVAEHPKDEGVKILKLFGMEKTAKILPFKRCHAMSTRSM